MQSATNICISNKFHFCYPDPVGDPDILAAVVAGAVGHGAVWSRTSHHILAGGQG